MKKSYFWAAVFVLGCAGGAPALRASAAEPDLPVLIRPVSVSLARSGGAQSALPPRLQAIEVDTTLLEKSIERASRLRASFGNTDVILVPGRVTARRNGQTWIGSVDGYPLSSSIFTMVNGTLNGTVDFDGRRYSIEPARTGSGYLAIEHDPNGAVPFLDDGVPPQLVGASPSTAYTAPAENGTRIDLLVLYTQELSTRYGTGLDSMIQHYVDIANAAYISSGINTQLNLVHTALLTDTDVAEGATGAQALPKLSTNATAAALRNTYNADLVSLLRVYHDSGGCGIAYVMGNVSSSFESLAFSVVEVRPVAEANPYYCLQTTLAHELGHNMGCAHDRDHANIPGAYSYSYGYDIPGVLATVMSYDQPTINYFSTPLVNYSGYPIGKPEGDPDSADNARGINQTRGVVSNFRVATAPAVTNLAPFEPSGWSNKVVLSTQTGTWQDSPLYANTNILLDLAVINDGDQAIPAGFWMKLWIDDSPLAEWQIDQSLAPGTWYQLSDYPIGTLSLGHHSLRLQIDSRANVTENNETDNQFTRGIIIQDPACVTTYSDVPPGFWAAAHISALACTQLTLTTGNYMPSAPLTRGQMAAFLVRALYGENFTYPTTPYFSDVPPSHGFFKYVQRLKADGLTMVTGTYGVDDQITRAVLAIFLVRTLYGENFAYSATPYFADVPPNHTAFKYIQKLKDENLTRVVGLFGDTDLLTRDQLAVFLARAFLGLD